MNALSRYAYWLHLKWPAGKVERLPRVDDTGRTSLAGVFVVGDLAGVPLLKFALDTGAAAAGRIADELKSAPTQATSPKDLVDVAILGGGVAGMSAALECQRRGLSLMVVEPAQPFSTIAAFPKGKPIFTYPTTMTPRGQLQVGATVKEELLAELRHGVAGRDVLLTVATADKIARAHDHLVITLADHAPVRARRVILAIGRTGNFRRLGVAGEDLPLVSNRLIDPAHHHGERVVIVGGGDTALEAAIALADPGTRAASVTLVHRGASLARAKPENVARVEALVASGALTLKLGQRVARIDPSEVVLASGERLPADTVFSLIGREPPLDLFRRSGIALQGERTRRAWTGLTAFFVAATVLYAMKAFGLFGSASWNPATIAREHLVDLQANNAPRDLWYTLAASASNGIGFFISLLYCAAVVVFGLDRIRRRKTPYVRRQTYTLIAFQLLPLFILPEILLPWLGHHGAFDSGILKDIADSLFPKASYDANGREYWRAYGFILAWPLFVWNVFTAEPLTGWLVISLIQTFVVIPLIVWRWGKGAYCGWVCSCGALAETLGDRHRDKMPHGKSLNRLNFLGQAILAIALVLLILRVVAWSTGWAWAGASADAALTSGWKPFVDFTLAGALGTGLYFGLSGRTWCRFGCPLAALMHIYARFSRFRIVADGKKCISCNACTATCHQGIDVMSFASRGAPMEDPQCVRCSACVSACPTGVLAFGQVDRKGNVSLDRLAASAVRLRERTALPPLSAPARTHDDLQH